MLTSNWRLRLYKLLAADSVSMPVKKKPIEKKTIFSDSLLLPEATAVQLLENANAKTFLRKPSDFKASLVATTDAKADEELKKTFDSKIGGIGSKFEMNAGSMSPVMLDWFASQGFQGFQTYAMLAQHWLINKCCLMPAEDATQNGFKIARNDGEKIAPEITQKLRKLNYKKYKLNTHLVDFLYKGRMFGIRHALFVVNSSDPNYYEKPFNIDGVKPGEYRGIVQIDPYWLAPELDVNSALDPLSLRYFKPTWWQINGKRIHHSHFVIMQTSEVADVLKPSYFYGGISIPQKVYERVYCAERTANEAPQLALAKRTTVLTTNVAKALANSGKFLRKMFAWVQLWNNFGVKVISATEKMEQHDTSLADFDAVIMSQYQLVAATANVPAVKLLGTTPKGFNSTGDYEILNYHQELKTNQTHHLEQMVERHTELVLKSDIEPEYGIEVFDFDIIWHPLGTMTAKELAELNNSKADTGSKLITSGALSPEDERNRLINDPDSGYEGLTEMSLTTDDPQTILEEYINAANEIDATA